MLNEQQQKQLSVLRTDIREIFLNDWNPFGVPFDDKGYLAQNEYDPYVSEIYGLLKLGSTIENLSKALIRIEKEDFGLSPSLITEKQAHIAAQKLIKVYMKTEKEMMQS